MKRALISEQTKVWSAEKHCQALVWKQTIVALPHAFIFIITMADIRGVAAAHSPAEIGEQCLTFKEPDECVAWSERHHFAVDSLCNDLDVEASLLTCWQEFYEFRHSVF